MSGRFGELAFIVTNSHPELGKRVAKRLEVEPLAIENGFFANQELDIRRLGDVSGRDVCVFSSLHARYDTIKELRLICQSIQNASRIFGVFPFVRDGKSDHQKRFGEPVAYKDTAEQISSSGVELIAIFDQHSSQHPWFYDTLHYKLRTVHHIYLMRILIEYVQERMECDGVIALDDGGFKRNKTIAEIIGSKSISFIVKYRDADTREVNVGKSQIVGDVRGKNLVSFEDMIQSASTLHMGALIAKDKGAKSITILAVHNDFNQKTFNRLNSLLENGILDKLLIVETLPLEDKDKWHKNLVVLSPDKFLSKVIDHIHHSKHMRSLFLEIN